MLVVSHPELLPDNIEGTKRVYSNMKDELKDVLGGCWRYHVSSQQGTRFDKLVEVAERPEEEEPATVVHKGENADGDGGRWSTGGSSVGASGRPLDRADGVHGTVRRRASREGTQGGRPLRRARQALVVRVIRSVMWALDYINVSLFFRFILPSK